MADKEVENKEEIKTVNKEGNKRGLSKGSKKALTGGNKSTKNSVTKSITQNASGNGKVSPEVKSYIKDKLFQQDRSGHNWMYKYINAFMDEALKEPGGACGKLIANGIFTENLMDKLDAELNKQQKENADFMSYRIRMTLYDKQMQVYDNLLDRTIQCICTRRAGKTELVARMIVREALKEPYETPTGKVLPRNALYLNRNFDNAVGQMGQPVIAILESLGIQFEGSLGTGVLTLPSGATITFSGYNNKGDIDRYRGNHYSMIALDEISHLRNPKVLMQETLEPALVDYGHEGRIIMTGTPPRSKKSYAYEMWHNDNIKHYHWSFMDNPFIPNKEEVVAKACKDHGVTEDAPFIQREYFGNMEAFDVDAMPFRGYKTYNNPALVKNQTWTHAYVGVDWGYEDSSAVIAAVASDKTKEMYVVSEWHAPHKATSEICQEVVNALTKLKEYNVARTPWVICDNNDKSGAYELYHTYKIPNVTTAYKYDKDMAIEQLAEWMRTGKVLIPEKGYLADECDNTLWQRDKDSDEIIHEIDDANYHPNGLFSLLYVSRQYDFDVLGGTHSKSAKEILEE